MTASASNMNKPDPEAWLVDPHEKTFHVMENKSIFESINLIIANISLFRIKDKMFSDVYIMLVKPRSKLPVATKSFLAGYVMMKQRIILLFGKLIYACSSV